VSTRNDRVVSKAYEGVGGGKTDRGTSKLQLLLEGTIDCNTCRAMGGQGGEVEVGRGER